MPVLRLPTLQCAHMPLPPPRAGGAARHLPRRLLRPRPLQDPGHEGDQGGPRLAGGQPAPGFGRTGAAEPQGCEAALQRPRTRCSACHPDLRTGTTAPSCTTTYYLHAVVLNTWQSAPSPSAAGPARQAAGAPPRVQEGGQAAAGGAAAHPAGGPQRRPLAHPRRCRLVLHGGAASVGAGMQRLRALTQLSPPAEVALLQLPVPCSRTRFPRMRPRPPGHRRAAKARGAARQCRQRHRAAARRAARA